jgi:hypothetical protein
MEQHYIGVVLHQARFQACALDGTGQRLWEASFARTANGIAEFRRAGSRRHARRCGSDRADLASCRRGAGPRRACASWIRARRA